MTTPEQAAGTPADQPGPDAAEPWRARQYAALAELALLALSDADLDEVLNAATSQLRQSLGCDYTRILDHRSAASGFVVRAGAGWPPGVIGETGGAAGEEADALEERSDTAVLRAPLLIHDHEAERPGLSDAEIQEHAIRSVLRVPIEGDSGLYGALEADSRSAGAFSEAHLPLMNAYAQLLARAFEQRERDASNANFASIAAHELRTPLTSVVGFSRRLLRQLDDHGAITADHREELELVYRESVRLQRAVELFLSLGDIERRQLVLSPRPVRVGEAMEETIALSDREYSSAEIELTVEDRDQVVHTDPLLLSRILDNLIGNAVKYSPAGAVVGVDAAIEDGELTVTVSDACGGIDEEDFPRLFRRAFRGGDAALGGPGLGIGLYVSLRLAELLGGSLTAENRPPVGCAFTLSVPTEPDAS